jgi:putative ABC transport system ATP-binding protein
MNDAPNPRVDLAKFAVVTERVTRTYVSGGNTNTAIDQVSMRVCQGEFVAIMGHSGSGKTTLLYLIAGVAEPTSGEIFIHGTPISSLTDAERARLRNRQMGFVFQRFNLLNFLSVEANVETPQLLSSGRRDGKGHRARDLLAKVGLAGRRMDSVNRLSAGEQQRVAIARALMNGPEILLADEPTGNLDSHNAGKVLELLLTLREEFKLTILMVTHNPEVALMADRILEIQDGRVRRELDTRSIPTRDEWLRRFATPFFE